MCKLYSLFSSNAIFEVKAESKQDRLFLKPDWVSSKKVSEYLLNFYSVFCLKFVAQIQLVMPV
jgi:hypothetical protein